ncbi:hypothetical protein [Streptomyces sp. NPDC059176]|uniref:hypothetical protein n=1 Tax=Streptomyces sp. NPDC059176 TaxID=3346758 RepID=UPI00369BD4D2
MSVIERSDRWTWLVTAHAPIASVSDVVSFRSWRVMETMRDPDVNPRSSTKFVAEGLLHVGFRILTDMPYTLPNLETIDLKTHNTFDI